MGQRHQIFIAAKINGKYRTLAVSHHQWLGQRAFDVITRCLYVLRVFTINQKAVSRELCRAAKLDWDKDIPKDREPTSGHVFPVIATMLFLATAYGGSDLSAQRIWLLSLNTTPEDTYNDDGFTIIDITDPAELRYAFFFGHELIGPRQYLGSYGAVPPDQPPQSDWLEVLEGRPQMSVNAMKDLWPKRPWIRSPEWLAEDHGKDDLSSDPATIDALRTTLKGMTLTTVVEQALTGGPESLGWIQQASEISGFRAALRARLREQPTLLNPESRVIVIPMAFEGCDVVDLAMIEGLKQPELLAIAKSLAAQSQTHDLALILPDMRDLTATCLKEILDTASFIRLDLGDTAASLEALLGVIKTSKVKHLDCPALWKRALQLWIDSASESGCTVTPSIPSGVFPVGADTSFPLSQVIYIRHYRSATNPRLPSGGVNWKRLLKRCTSKTSFGGIAQSFEDRPAVPNVLVMPLNDALLSPQRIVLLIPKLIKQCCESRDKWLEPGHMSSSTGLALALGLSVTDDDKVSAIPAEAFMAWKTFHRSDVGPRIREPTAGSWSLVVFHEVPHPDTFNVYGPQPQPEVRSAFYTKRESNTLDALDAGAFFEAVSPMSGTEGGGASVNELTKQWHSKMAEVEAGADPPDEKKRGPRVKGGAFPASVDEVQGGLKMMDAYNQQIERELKKNRR